MRLNQHLASVEFVTVWSKDLDESRRFYIDRLGLPILRERGGEFFQFEIAGMHVCVDYHPEHSGKDTNQIGLRVNDLKSVMALMEQAGCQVKSGEQQETAEMWASVKDPDGHELIFISHAKVEV